MGQEGGRKRRKENINSKFDRCFFSVGMFSLSLSVKFKVESGNFILLPWQKNWLFKENPIKNTFMKQQLT